MNAPAILFRIVRVRIGVNEFFISFEGVFSRKPFVIRTQDAVHGVVRHGADRIESDLAQVFRIRNFIVDVVELFRAWIVLVFPELGISKKIFHEGADQENFFPVPFIGSVRRNFYCHRLNSECRESAEQQCRSNDVLLHFVAFLV